MDILDGGGVKCKSCTNKLGLRYISSNHKPGVCGTMGGRNAETTSMGQYKESNDVKQPSTSGNIGLNGFLRQSERGDIFSPPGEFTIDRDSNLDVLPIRSSQRETFGVPSVNGLAKDTSELPFHPDLSFSLGVTMGKSQSFSGIVVEEREPSGPPTFLQQGPPSGHLLPQLPKPASFDASVNLVPQMRVVRPPVESRGRNQLLPRYWPRITDQELQQISGDSNCTIVPLFEKVLSASDAGRIGRLVLPKACAEAYFPPISQPEGLPLRVQDVKGNQWVFQFRFWPNNNSRMYVLEGVIPCIQSMQLQAGDTVTFSRIDPEGKLVMGFRKALNSMAVQPVKGNTDSQLSTLLMQNESTTCQTSWHNSEKNESKKEEGVLISTFTERKRSRNIGSKSKRLLIDHREVLELRLRWEEVQEMLRPPQSVNPGIVVVEGYEFEEYEEPPVFGKWSVFAIRSFGLLEQWTQCDSCYKWRRVPVDILLPPKWSCTENSWDQSRCSCSALEELSPRELEKFMQLTKDFKKKRVATGHAVQEKESCSGLDALANAAILGDKLSDPSASPVALTTKHPRHRPGCSCIVCIQPPSGKGKHSPDCICFSCETVKRRFKTLMLRKKQRQSEQEAEMAQQRLGEKNEAELEAGNSICAPVAKSRHKPDCICLSCVKVKHRTLTVIPRKKQPQAEKEAEVAHTDHQKQSREDETEGGVTIARHIRSHLDEPDEEEAVATNGFQRNCLCKPGESSKGLDLNCQPSHEAELQIGRAHDSMIDLQSKSLPLETYTKEKVLVSLTQLDQQATSGSNLLEQMNAETKGQFVENQCTVVPLALEANAGHEDKSQNDQQ
ncbi:hypothetical protein Dimus_006898 [Dionaea muscipula]